MNSVAVEALPSPVDHIATAQIRLATLTERAAWDAFVATHPEASGYHRWAWRSVFEHGLGQRCLYLSAWDANRLVGVLPLVRVKSLLFGRALSSLPYVNYGGVSRTPPRSPNG